MSAEVRCRCCGVDVGRHPLRKQVRVCVDCDQCDQLHGATLQGVLAKAVADGKLSPFAAIARSMFDDGQLTGRLVRIVDDDGPDARVVSVLLNDPPPRWMVMGARMVCRGELPDVQTLVDAVTTRWLPCASNSPTLRKLEAELRDALQFIDPEIMDVRVTCTRDPSDTSHLVIEIQAKTPVLGIQSAAENVVIPDDIMSRKRAEA